MKRAILGLLFVLIGGGTLWWGSRATSRTSVDRNLLTERGKVLASTVAEDSMSAGGGSYRIRYRPDIRYRFMVNGENYESNVFTFGAPKSFAQRAEAEGVVAAHPEGSDVTVYYEPGNPARSGLEPGSVPRGFGMFAMLSSTFVLIGVLLFMSGAIGWARSELVGR